MSLEHSPARASGVALQSGNGDALVEAELARFGDAAFWLSLINEAEAAKFLNLTARCLQGWRYKGSGPKFVRISGRCIKYRRADLRAWAEARLRTSTADPGPE